MEEDIKGAVSVVEQHQENVTGVPSIHPSSTAHPESGSHGQQSQQRHPDFPGPSHLLQRHCPSGVSWAFLKDSSYWGIPGNTSLARHWKEKSSLLSRSSPPNPWTQPVPVGAPRPPGGGTHFGCLY